MEQSSQVCSSKLSEAGGCLLSVFLELGLVKDPFHPTPSPGFHTAAVSVSQHRCSDHMIGLSEVKHSVSVPFICTCTMRPRDPLCGLGAEDTLPTALDPLPLLTF